MSAVVQRRDDLGAVEKHLQLRFERVRDDPFRVCGGVPEAAAEIVLPDEVLLRENAPVAVEHFERHRVDERRVCMLSAFHSLSTSSTARSALAPSIRWRTTAASSSWVTA